MYNNADEIAHTVSHCMGVFFVLKRFCSKISWMVIKKHTNIGIVVNIDKIITNAKLIKLSIKTKVFIAKYAKLNNTAKAIVEGLMPGQITMITEAQPGLPTWCVSDVGQVGIRIADYELVRNLIRKTGKPLLVPSANKSGEQPGTTAQEVVNAFGDEIAAVIDGKTISNQPSTIVFVEDKHTDIIREGAIKIEDIKRVIKKE